MGKSREGLELVLIVVFEMLLFTCGASPHLPLRITNP